MSSALVGQAVANPLLYRLIYFNVRGAVEPVRLLLALANVPYDDVRYPMTAAAAGFSVDQSFQRDKAAGHFSANMDNLPILQVLHKVVEYDCL